MFFTQMLNLIFVGTQKLYINNKVWSSSGWQFCIGTNRKWSFLKLSFLFPQIWGWRWRFGCKTGLMYSNLDWFLKSLNCLTGLRQLFKYFKQILQLNRCCLNNKVTSWLLNLHSRSVASIFTEGCASNFSISF